MCTKGIWTRHFVLACFVNICQSKSYTLQTVQFSTTLMIEFLTSNRSIRGSRFKNYKTATILQQLKNTPTNSSSYDNTVEWVHKILLNYLLMILLFFCFILLTIKSFFHWHCILTVTAVRNSTLWFVCIYLVCAFEC